MTVRGVRAFMNDDGFLTKDKHVAECRDILLNDPDRHEFGYRMELKYWSQTPEIRARIDKIKQLEKEDNANVCPTCLGSGKGESCQDEYGRWDDGGPCKDCDRSGLTKEYRERTGRKVRHEGCWYNINNHGVNYGIAEGRLASMTAHPKPKRPGWIDESDATTPAQAKRSQERLKKLGEKRKEPSVGDSPTMGGAGAVAARELKGFTNMVLDSIKPKQSWASVPQQSVPEEVIAARGIFEMYEREQKLRNAKQTIHSRYAGTLQALADSEEKDKNGRS